MQMHALCHNMATTMWSSTYLPEICPLEIYVFQNLDIEIIYLLLFIKIIFLMSISNFDPFHLNSKQV